MAQYHVRRQKKHSKMKTFIILCALVAVVVSRPEEPETATYSSQYDNFDAQELANNVRLLKNYAKCFIGKGPCTTEGTDFKKVIPDALKSKCSKCSPKQKDLIRIVVKALQQKAPELWEELVKKEDPKGEFKQDLDAFIKGN